MESIRSLQTTFEDQPSSHGVYNPRNPAVIKYKRRHRRQGLPFPLLQLDDFPKICSTSFTNTPCRLFYDIYIQKLLYVVYDIIHCKKRYEILRRFVIEKEIMLVAIIKLFSTTLFPFLNHKAILKLDGGSILRRIYFFLK